MFHDPQGVKATPWSCRTQTSSNHVPWLSIYQTKTLIFHDFQGPTMKFHEFPGLENEILKFHDFPGFPWPVRILEQVTDNLAFTFLLAHLEWPFSLYPLVNLKPLTSNSLHIQSDFDVQLDPQRVVFCSVAHNPMGQFMTFTQWRIPDHRGNSPPHWIEPFSTRLFYTYNSLTSNSLHVQRDLDVHRGKFSHKIAKHVREC